MSDANVIFNTIQNEREYLREWLPFVDYTNDISDTRFFIRSVLSPQNSHHEFVALMLFKGEFAGLIGFKSTDLENKKTEIGYWLSEKYQRHGIVSKSCQFLINFAFDVLGINRIQIRVAVKNTRSCRIPERLHFTFEGVERAGELLINGYTDINVYSILHEDHLQLHHSHQLKRAS